MTSVGGIDLSVALANRVRAQDAARAGSANMPSINNPGLSGNPDLDIFGRETGLQLTSGNAAGERTQRAIEASYLDNRPQGGETNYTLRPFNQSRDGLYAQTIYQSESQYNVLNTPPTTLVPKTSSPDTQTTSEGFQ